MRHMTKNIKAIPEIDCKRWKRSVMQVISKQNWYVYIKVKKLNFKERGTWLAQLIKHAILDVRAVSSSPIYGVEVT